MVNRINFKRLGKSKSVFNITCLNSLNMPLQSESLLFNIKNIQCSPILYSISSGNPYLANNSRCQEIKFTNEKKGNYQMYSCWCLYLTGDASQNDLLLPRAFHSDQNRDQQQNFLILEK